MKTPYITDSVGQPMLHTRYHKKHKLKDGPHRSSVDREIQLLKCIQCDDKTHIPEELKYRDRGHMYFPSKEILCFLKHVDACVMENANEASFKKYGSEMIEVAVKQLEATQELRQELRQKFNSYITMKLSSKQVHNVSDFENEIISVYKELTSKLCHTRLGEFMKATELSSAASQGLSTLAGQNLGDGLPTCHVQTKSKIS